MAKVIIIDDASFMRSSLQYIIEKAGHEVVGLGSGGEEGLKLYRETKPDLVTLDILMKDMNGIVVLKEMLKENPEAKVVMITALGLEEQEEEARKAGALGYIKKPFKLEDVTQEIERVLKKG